MHLPYKAKCMIYYYTHGHKKTYIISVSGAYVPLTAEGNIVVDGVLASCYTSVNYDITHIGMTPLQWFPKTVQLVFGEDNGFSAFARIIKESAKSIMLFGQLLQYQSIS